MHPLVASPPVPPHILYNFLDPTSHKEKGLHAWCTWPGWYPLPIIFLWCMLTEQPHKACLLDCGCPCSQATHHPSFSLLCTEKQASYSISIVACLNMLISLNINIIFHYMRIYSAQMSSGCLNAQLDGLLCNWGWPVVQQVWRLNM